MIAGMASTVLAGPVEFSPAEIMVIVAVLAAFFVLVTSPGWVALGVAFRRRRLARGPGRTWPAALGGCGLGVLVCAGITAGVGALFARTGTSAAVAGVAASWLVCWLLAALLNRSAGDAGPATRTPDGWGG